MDETIGAGEFKAACPQPIDEVAERRQPLIITKPGQTLAKLVPVGSTAPLFGSMAGSVIREDDLVSPLDAQWEAAE